MARGRQLSEVSVVSPLLAFDTPAASGRQAFDAPAASGRQAFDAPIVPFPCADRAPTDTLRPSTARIDWNGRPPGAPKLIGIAAMADRAPLLEAKSRVE